MSREQTFRVLGFWRRARRAAVVAAVASIALIHTDRADALNIEQVAKFSDQPNALIVRDINGDDRPDLLAASGCSLYVVNGTGPGTFGAPVRHALPAGMQSCGVSPASLAVGDVTGDGHLDAVVVRNLFSNNVLVLPGKSDGTLDAPIWVGSVSYHHGVALGDLNGDNHDDILTLQDYSWVSVILANPAGGFESPQLYQQDYELGSTVATGRFDGDSDVDVAVGVQGYCADSAPDCQHKNGVVEYLGNGDGTLGSPVTQNGRLMTAAHFGATAQNDPETGASLGSAEQILAAPLRGLTRDDMIVTNPLVQPFFPAADGALAVSDPPFAVGGRGDVDDLDVDGALDVGLVGVYQNESVAALLLGDGSGSFDVALLYGFNGIGLRDAQIADVDDDNWPDVVAVAGDTVFVAFNTPTAASDPEELDFGTLPPGTRSSPLTATIVNVGPRPLRVAGASLAGAAPGDYRIASNRCAQVTLDVLDGCDMTVAFTPSAVGNRAGELSIASDDPDAPLAIPLYGAGAPPGTAPTPAAPKPATTDTTAPALKVKVARQRLRAVLRRGLELRVGCSEACKVTLRASVNRRQARSLRLKAPARGRVVGTAVVDHTRAGTRRFVLKLSRPLRRAARRARRLTLRLTAEATDPAGNHTKLSGQTVRLRR